MNSTSLSMFAMVLLKSPTLWMTTAIARGHVRVHAKVESKGNNIFSLEPTKTNKQPTNQTTTTTSTPILIKETTVLLTVLFTDLFTLNHPKLAPSSWQEGWSNTCIYR